MSWRQMHNGENNQTESIYVLFWYGDNLVDPAENEEMKKNNML